MKSFFVTALVLLQTMELSDGVGSSCKTDRQKTAYIYGTRRAGAQFSSTNDGQTLWTYEDGGVTDEYEYHFKARAALPGPPRPKLLSLVKLTGSAISKGEELAVTSRPYWPGLKSLFDNEVHSCRTTPEDGLPAGTPPRDQNMMDSFVRSLLSGKLFSGVDMKNKLDPMAVYHGWHRVYDVSLPRIGLAVRDTADYTLPVTPNDRICETIGSYAYREGVTFLPGPLNLLKRTSMRA